MFIIIILSVVPIIIWAFMEPLGMRFSDLNTTTTSIGQIFGLVGMTLFSINLILSGRFKFLDKFFKGLDKVYVNHHRFGAISFSLLLFHPIFLVFKYVTSSLYDAGLFFLPYNNTPNTYGIIALFLMIVLIYATFFVNIKYQHWKLSHKFMTLAFFFAVLHVIFITSDVSRSLLLKSYILALAGLAFLVVIVKFYKDQTGSNRYKYKVKNVRELNEYIVEVEMEPVEGKMAYTSGQFAFFNFFSENISFESHPFTISSTATDNNLRITIKNLGDYTSLVKNLKAGDNVLVDGPYGRFSYKEFVGKNQIWIAGGIGITPFMSMVQDLKTGYNVDLYYSVKEEKEGVYLNTMREIAIKNSNFRFNLWVTKDKGYIKGDLISGMSNGLEDKEIFLCGPAMFMESLKAQFISLGVDINRIHYENFNL